MKGLADIFSGKRYRANLSDELVVGEAMKRFRFSAFESDASLQNYAKALTLSTSVFIRYLLYESGLPDYIKIGKDFDREKISDCAAFVASWESRTYIGDLVAANDVGVDDALSQEDMEVAVSKIMEVTAFLYPPSRRAQEAIELWEHADDKRVDALNHTLGLASVRETDPVEKMKRNLSVLSMFGAHRDMLARAITRFNSQV